MKITIEITDARDVYQLGSTIKLMQKELDMRNQRERYGYEQELEVNDQASPSGDIRDYTGNLPDYDNGEPDHEDGPEFAGYEERAGDTSQADDSDNTDSAPDSGSNADVDLDANGRPWDERIHSSAKKKNQDGTWKYRRGVHKTVKEQVEAELDAAESQSPISKEEEEASVAPLGGPTNSDENGTGAPPTPQADAPPPPPPAQQAAPAPQADAPPPPPASAPAPSPPASDGEITWPTLLGRIMKEKVDEDKVAAACQKHGVDSFPLVATRTDLIPTIYRELFGNG